MGIVFHASYLTRRMFKIMYGPAVALFDDLLPSAGQQLPQIPADGWIPHRVFKVPPLVGTHPRGTEPEAYTSGVHVKWHCHPFLQEFTSLLVKCLRFFEVSHARAQPPPEAGAR